MDDNMIINKSSEVITVKTKDNIVLMSPNEPSGNFIYAMNETASYIWFFIDGKTTIGQIKDKLVDGYDMTKGQAKKELAKFVENLRLINALTLINKSEVFSRAQIDKKLNRPPIIIGGCARSGTTLLLSILSSHPSILVIPHETYTFCPTGYTDKPDINRQFEIQKIYDYISDFFAFNGIKTSHRRWSEKSPKNILFFGKILEYLQNNVRLINMIRDGRDVVTSIHKGDITRSWVSPERWVNDVREGLKYDNSPLVLTVRYEDLVMDFNKTIRKICGFIGEECNGSILNWHKNITCRLHSAWKGEVEELHSRSIGRWRDPKYRAVIDNFMRHPETEELLKHYRYVDR